MVILIVVKILYLALDRSVEWADWLTHPSWHWHNKVWLWNIFDHVCIQSNQECEDWQWAQQTGPGQAGCMSGRFSRHLQTKLFLPCTVRSAALSPLMCSLLDKTNLQLQHKQQQHSLWSPDIVYVPGEALLQEWFNGSCFKCCRKYSWLKWSS